MKPTDIPTTLACVGEIVGLSVGGNKLSKTERRELLRSLRQGEIVELDVEALVFHQHSSPLPLPIAEAKKANANFLRFRDADLAALAKSFKGKLFLKDHSRSFDDVGGKITASELVENDGRYSFRQTIHLIRPWAAEAALDGTLETFSIGWAPKKRSHRAIRGSLLCSVCNGPWLSRDCPHMPGDEVQLDESGQRAVVELICTSVKGAETSAVPFPAVDGTRIDEVRAALAAVKAENASKDKDEMKTSDIAKKLGLGEDADEAAVLAEVKRLAAASKGQEALSTELEAARIACESAKTALAEVTAQRAAEQKARVDAEVAALKEGALSSGLWEPGSRKEVLFDKLATQSVESAREFVESLEPTIPVGAPPQSVGTAPPKPAAGSTDALLQSEYGCDALQLAAAKAQFKQLGITDEMFAAHGQHNYDE